MFFFGKKIFDSQNLGEGDALPFSLLSPAHDANNDRSKSAVLTKSVKFLPIVIWHRPCNVDVGLENKNIHYEASQINSISHNSSIASDIGHCGHRLCWKHFDFKLSHVVDCLINFLRS